MVFTEIHSINFDKYRYPFNYLQIKTIKDFHHCRQFPHVPFSPPFPLLKPLVTTDYFLTPIGLQSIFHITF